MKKILVKSSKNNYFVCIGTGLLKKAGILISSVFPSETKLMVVSQKKISSIYFKILSSELRKRGFKVFLHIVPTGECAKSEKELFKLLKALLRKGFERRDGLIALGGGVVGDLTGFAAASYLRGIKYVHVATTLLAQVDSAIGGKTAIDLEEGKNLMGAFHPPSLVISDVSVLKTLSDKELRASLAEVVKYGVIRDKELFNFLVTNNKKILSKNPSALEKIVVASSKIKAGVVTRDEYETKGERIILNYGHTFAHGIEGALKYEKIVHGEAVAIGMVMAARLSNFSRLCSKETFDRQIDLLKVFRLPLNLSKLKVSPKKIFSVMMNDKKKKNGKLRFVLPQKIGKVTVKTDVPASLIRKVII